MNGAKAVIGGARSDAMQSIIAFGLKGGAGLANYGFFALAARLAGAETFGAFSILFSTAMIISLAGSFGQQTFLLKEVPKARAHSSIEDEIGAYRFAFTSSAIAALVGGIVFIATSLTLPHPVEPSAIGAGALLCILYSMSQVTIAALRIEGRLQLALATRDVLWRVFAIAALAVLALSVRPDTTTLTAVLALALLPIVGAHAALILRRLPKLPEDARPRLRTHEWLKLSTGLMLIAMIAGADIYVYTITVGYLLPVNSAGAFFAAMKSVELLALFLLSVTLVIVPDLSRLIAANDREALQRKCNQAILVQSGPTLAVSLLMMVAAPYFMWLFRPEYVADANVLRILVLAMIVSALTGAGGSLMQLSGLHWRQVVYQAGSLIIAVALMLPLVSWFGLLGAAVSFLISKVLWNVLAAHAAYRHLGVDPSVLALVRTAFRRGPSSPDLK